MRSTITMGVAGLVCVLGMCGANAQGGVTVLLSDRDQNVVWRLFDADNNGIIDATEVSLWYGVGNASGTGPADNLNAFFAGPDGVVYGGDQVLQVYYRFEDLNHDGDAMDAGECRVVATTANASAASTTFPTGGAALPGGDLMIVNAGNGFGVDAIYRCHDLTSDGTFEQAGEITQFVGDSAAGFGPGNGPFSPQEMVLTDAGVGFLRNSSANLHGVYRFADANASGRADDLGEFVRWYTGASAGFALEPDRLRPGALYYHQLAAGSADQILRLRDANGNDNADDAGEAELVFSTTEAGFTSVDILCLPDGDVLFTDNSGKRIIRLHDIDGDGKFLLPEERTDFFVAAGTMVGDVRQVVLIPSPSACGTADFDGDGDIGTDADIEAFFACLGGNCCTLCFPGGADFNGDGDIGTDADIEAFFRVLGGGSC